MEARDRESEDISTLNLKREKEGRFILLIIKGIPVIRGTAITCPAEAAFTHKGVCIGIKRKMRAQTWEEKK